MAAAKRVQEHDVKDPRLPQVDRHYRPDQTIAFPTADQVIAHDIPPPPPPLVTVSSWAF